MIDYIMNIFLDENAISIMGNWYARVYAVMSCVIPCLFILGVFAMFAMILHEVFKILK